jgi:hypothetical protein
MTAVWFWDYVGRTPPGFPFSLWFILLVTLKGSGVRYLWYIKCKGIEWVTLGNERAKTRETTDKWKLSSSSRYSNIEVNWSLKKTTVIIGKLVQTVPNVSKWEPRLLQPSLCYPWHIFEDASSLRSYVDHVIIIRKSICAGNQKCHFRDLVEPLFCKVWRTSNLF